VRPDLPSGTVTFLFTDVEGSTRCLHAGQLTYYKGDPNEAQRLLDQALGLWRLSGDGRGTAETLVYLGIAAGDSNEPVLARSAGRERVVGSATR
jgi:steroid 5-alpha reductase family enzyme